jgi:hypothetical protein
VLYRINCRSAIVFVTSVVCQSHGTGLSHRSRPGACIFVDIYKRLVQRSMIRASRVAPPKARRPGARPPDRIAALTFDERHLITPVVLDEAAAPRSDTVAVASDLST